MTNKQRNTDENTQAVAKAARVAIKTMATAGTVRAENQDSEWEGPSWNILHLTSMLNQTTSIKGKYAPKL